MSQPQKFRKKPVVIEAVEVTGWTESEFVLIADWCGGNVVKVKIPGHTQFAIDIPTLEGTMRADLNDYIIKGVKGEFYPCKPDIFEATYEPVAAPHPPREGE